MAHLTMAEKILSRHSKQKILSPGEIVEATIDIALSHEMIGSLVLPQLESANIMEVWDPSRVVVILDHWVPAPSVEAATIHQRVRAMIEKFKIEHFYDVGQGISHQVLVEEGHVRPGELIVGTDSHTTTAGAFGALATGIGATDMAIGLATGQLWFRVPDTLRINLTGRLPTRVMGKDVMLYLLNKLGVEGASFNTIEFHGKSLKLMSLDAWMTLTNMAVEAGAMGALIPPDTRVTEYVKARTSMPFKPVYPDDKAHYIQHHDLDISNLEPQVSKPALPTNAVPVSEVEGIPIDQAFLGSCTNGRLEDLRVAAQIVRGHTIAPEVRFIVNPASQKVFIKALEKGFIKILAQAGAIIGPPTCGACFGGHCGVLAPNEVCISTTNRNFPARMGSAEAKIYLASPATVAASAIKGWITDPRTEVKSRAKV
ncbi:MAG: 3-isopropylmalate dehydratase large subunit [Candidatus Thorarchaeota archaeon]